MGTIGLQKKEEPGAAAGTIGAAALNQTEREPTTPRNRLDEKTQDSTQVLPAASGRVKWNYSS